MQRKDIPSPMGTMPMVGVCPPPAVPADIDQIMEIDRMRAATRRLASRRKFWGDELWDHPQYCTL